MRLAILCISILLTLSSIPAYAQTVRVGTWNLEHFGDDKGRGFPENRRGGPSYPGRTDAQYDNVARIIHELDFGVLALQEINGREAKLFFDESIGEYVVATDADIDAAVDDDLEIWQVSTEVEKLVDALASNHSRDFQYIIAEEGRSQRLALMWDTDRVEQVGFCEADFENTRVQGKGLFDRQPLVSEFRLLDAAGDPANDFVVVNVHLASGQQNGRNHRDAMRRIRRQIMQWRVEDSCISANEHDVVIMGDFNAQRFTGAREFFFDDMEGDGQMVVGDEGHWDVLGDDPQTYLATRLSGVPLAQGGSVIDYIIATRFNAGFLGMGSAAGMVGQEIDANITQAHVHAELVTAAGGADSFRRDASDHLPVSVDVIVIPDDD